MSDYYDRLDAPDWGRPEALRPWRPEPGRAVGFHPDAPTCMCDFEDHILTGCTHDL